jgi:hypothetical protein
MVCLVQIRAYCRGKKRELAVGGGFPPVSSGTTAIFGIEHFWQSSVLKRRVLVGTSSKISIWNLVKGVLSDRGCFGLLRAKPSAQANNFYLFIFFQCLLLLNINEKP